MASFSYVGPIIDKMSEAPIESDYKVVNIRGVPQNPSLNVETFEDIIDNFQTKDGDVFIATYVKAGTTWTQQIVHLLLRQGEPGGKYGESCPWLEACASELIQPREAPTWNLEKINAAPAPRYFKTHAIVAHLPRGNAKVKTIVVARNPKDTCVSLYHHAKSKPEFEYTGSFDKFCNIFLAGHAENGSWFDHVLGWYKKCQEEPETHLFLKYEDMCDDTTGAVRKIADFLNIPVTEEVISQVVKNSSMSEMKVTASIGLNHLRQGGYGNWRGEFSVAMSEFFDDVYLYKMEGSGITFNFGRDSRGNDVFL